MKPFASQLGRGLNSKDWPGRLIEGSINKGKNVEGFIQNGERVTEVSCCFRGASCSVRLYVTTTGMLRSQLLWLVGF